ncbi:MAG: 23S ribosomal RNA methyltransferase Erm [Pseudoclavibacter sp.]
MPTLHGGRHEHGQNFLSDAAIIRRMISQVARTRGHVVEIGPGRGALTTELARLGRPVTAVEIDPGLARRLERDFGTDIRVVNDDFVRWRSPAAPHVVVGNLPFHLTTAMLRKLLRTPSCTHAVLLVQWEVARRRAGVGGITMMTAQWWPWVTFELHGRVPAAAFSPRPAVDGGLLTITRRPDPLVPDGSGDDYRAFVHAVFQGRGRGLAEIVRRAVPPHRLGRVDAWLARERVGRGHLPRDLDAEQWAGLFIAARGHGGAPRPARGRSSRGRASRRPGRSPGGGA